MAAEWLTMSLREAGVSLLDCEHRTPPAQEHGYPYVGIPQIKDGRIQLDDARRITREHFDEWTRKAKPEVFDVVLSRRCNPGETAFVTNNLDFALGQNLVLLRSDGTRVFGPFLRWLVRSPSWWEQVRKYINVGAVFDSLKCADIPGFQLPIPKLSEQRAIAHILSTLDDKIELNRRMNETLEAMARALFKSWFVDFDPVCAKMEGRDPGLPKPLAELFPDRLVDSELGEIPEGWEIRSLGDIAETTRGRSYRSKELTDSNVALVTLKSFARGGGYKPEGLKSFSGKFNPNQIVRPGEIVVACTDVTQNAAVIGRPEMVQESTNFDVLVASLDTLIVRPKDSCVTRAFLYFLMKEAQFVAHTYAHCTGTTVLHLTKDAVPSFRCAIPLSGLMRSFHDFADRHLCRVDVIRRESEFLVALRDALLPRLISGDIRLRGTERLVEAVA